jgi:hypothetical protein
MAKWFYCLFYRKDGKTGRNAEPSLCLCAFVVQKQKLLKQFQFVLWSAAVEPFEVF